LFENLKDTSLGFVLGEGFKDCFQLFRVDSGREIKNYFDLPLMGPIPMQSVPLSLWGREFSNIFLSSFIRVFYLELSHCQMFFYATHIPLPSNPDPYVSSSASNLVKPEFIIPSKT
jgi:hypothetical protein